MADFFESHWTTILVTLKAESSARVKHQGEFGEFGLETLDSMLRTIAGKDQYVVRRRDSCKFALVFANSRSGSIHDDTDLLAINEHVESAERLYYEGVKTHEYQPGLIF